MTLLDQSEKSEYYYIMVFSKKTLVRLYLDRKHSASEIAEIFDCSVHKVDYWIKKYQIPKRSISEAVYNKHNPGGDPFSVKEPKNLKDAILFGLGIGLYWGEGTKRNEASIRLGNSDPRLIKKFIEFLIKFYCIKRKKLRFGLQIFSDMPAQDALRFWVKSLKFNPKQFSKVIVTPARSLGTYRFKTQHGVLTVNYHNKKLRDILMGALEKISE